VMMVGNAARTIAWDKAREGVRDARASNPIFASAPAFIAEGLLFPYLGGAEFVRTAMGDGISSAQLLSQLPTSTSQVLHTDKWGPQGNAAELVRFAARGATVRYENSFGEFGTRLMLAELLGDVGRASWAARGHDGDRYAVLAFPAGDGLALVTAWDTALDAEEFAEAMAVAMAKRYASSVLPMKGQREIITSWRRVTVRTDKVGTRDITIVEDLPDAIRTPIITAADVTLTAR